MKPRFQKLWKYIEKAVSLMEEQDRGQDQENKGELTKLQDRLRELSGNEKLQIKDLNLPCMKKDPVLFHENNGRYGYRRIHALPSRGGTAIPRKVARRTMAEDGLVAKAKSRRKYNPYLGGIPPSVPNVVNRGFYAEKPNEKWLTGTTELAIPAGKAIMVL